MALDHGAEVAAVVARRLVMPLHRAGGQAQYVEQPIAREPAAAPSASCSTGRGSASATASAVDDLARRAAMSPRTLSRHFATHVGLPPGAWLATERVRLAQRLLETDRRAVEAIARRAGYASPATMRAQFAARLGTSPLAYRQGFRRPA